MRIYSIFQYEPKFANVFKSTNTKHEETQTDKYDSFRPIYLLFPFKPSHSAWF